MSLIGLYTNSFVPIDGNDLLKGVEESPYCNIRFRKSFFPKKFTPCNSEFSLSSQFPAGNNSVMEFKV